MCCLFADLAISCVMCVASVDLASSGLRVASLLTLLVVMLCVAPLLPC